MPTKRTPKEQPALGEQARPKRRGRPPGRKNKQVQPQVNWRDFLELGADEQVREREKTSKGTLGQDDIEQYDVIDAGDRVVGTVSYSAMTSLTPPFRTTHLLNQRDAAGQVIMQRRW